MKNIIHINGIIYNLSKHHDSGSEKAFIKYNKNNFINLKKIENNGWEVFIFCNGYGYTRLITNVVYDENSGIIEIDFYNKEIAKVEYKLKKELLRKNGLDTFL